jgi:hypothetical protein
VRPAARSGALLCQSQVPDRVEFHHGPGVGRLDDGVGTVEAGTDVHDHVVDAGPPEVVEQEVARTDRAERDGHGLLVLDLGRVQEIDPRAAPGEHGEPRAVQSARAGAAPLVGDAEIRLGRLHCLGAQSGGALR